jgi:hypothetical protein
MPQESSAESFDLSPNSPYDEIMPRHADSNPISDLSNRLGIPVWLVFLLVVAIPAVVVEFTRSEMHFASIDTQLTDLPSNIGNQFDSKLANLKTDLIKEFLTRAKVSSAKGDESDASAALRAASILTSIAKEDREPAGANFFKEAVFDLTSIQPLATIPSVLAAPTHDASVQLASYRSAIEPAPPLPKKRIEIGGSKTTKDIAHAYALEGGAIIAYGGPPGFDMFSFPSTGLPTEFENFAFADGSQILDNGIWTNVVFLNMHIKYQGGFVQLTNVSFVGCSFSFALDSRSFALANAIALNRSVLIAPPILH